MPVRTQPRLPNLNASALTLRDRLMGAALSLFSEFGFHGVAVPKIAKAAGIATGSIYSYFSSKEDLANELFWTWKLQLKSYYLTDYPAAASIEDQFCFIWARLHSYADDYPE
ncbi:MAG: TetR/AcrR family transcriptional regulator, partial [Proteobacteria bacterium]